MTKTLTAAALAWAAQSARAHDGHGLPGTAHWHATDVLGFVAVGVVAIGLALWSRRK